MGYKPAPFSTAIKPYLETAKKALWRMSRPVSNEQYDQFLHDCKTLESEVIADWYRQSQPEISRRIPVYWGNAIDLTDGGAFHPAKIYLVDSATSEGLDKIPRFTIHAFSMRSFVPNKGALSEKGYLSHVKDYLACDNRSADKAQQVIGLNIKNGMIEGSIPLHTPKVCIVYANIDSKNDRLVFMLRPRHKLNNRLYAAYCIATMDMFMARRGGVDKVDFNMWNNLSIDTKQAYMQSMFLTDTMLALKKEELKRFPAWEEMHIRWRSPDMYAVA